MAEATGNSKCPRSEAAAEVDPMEDHKPLQS